MAKIRQNLVLHGTVANKGIAFGKLSFVKRADIGHEKKEIKNAEQPSDAKIYYIKDVVPKKKPRKTVSRKPDLAFKGIVIRPEEFSEKKYYVNGK